MGQFANLKQRRFMCFYMLSLSLCCIINSDSSRTHPSYEWHREKRDWLVNDPVLLVPG